MNREVKPIDADEWNFIDKCPKGKIRACREWECLRDIIRRPNGLEVAQELHHPLIPRKFLDSIHPLYKSLNRYMPEVPYLRLPADFKEILQKISPPLIFKIDAIELPVGGLADVLPNTWGPDLIPLPFSLATLTLGIDWNLPDAAMTKRFREIIETERERRKISPPKKRTGRADDLSTQLKWLAARRILKAVAGNINNAKKIRDLYEDASAWSDAASKAGQVLDQVWNQWWLPKLKREDQV